MDGQCQEQEGQQEGLQEGSRGKDMDACCSMRNLFACQTRQACSGPKASSSRCSSHPSTDSPGAGLHKWGSLFAWLPQQPAQHWNRPGPSV